MAICYGSGMSLQLRMRTVAIVCGAVIIPAAPVKAQQEVETSILSRPNAESVLLCHRVEPQQAKLGHITLAFEVAGERFPREFVITFDSSAQPRSLELFADVDMGIAGRMLQHVAVTFGPGDSISATARYVDPSWVTERSNVKPTPRPLSFSTLHADSIRRLAQWAWEKRCSP